MVCEPGNKSLVLDSGIFGPMAIVGQMMTEHQLSALWRMMIPSCR
jgi:hypothetical protein